jgi:hypothetical protein
MARIRHGPTFNCHEPMVCPDCKEARTLQNRKRPQLVRSRCLQPSPSVTVAAFIVIAFVLFPRRTTDWDKVKHLPQIDAVSAQRHDAVGHRFVLERYFAYSIQEREDLGRCLHLTEPTNGASVWLLPQSPAVQLLPHKISVRSWRTRSMRKAARIIMGSSSLRKRKPRACLPMFPGISRLWPFTPKLRGRDSAGNFWNRRFAEALPSKSVWHLP